MIWEITVPADPHTAHLPAIFCLITICIYTSQLLYTCSTSYSVCNPEISTFIYLSQRLTCLMFSFFVALYGTICIVVASSTSIPPQWAVSLISSQVLAVVQLKKIESEVYNTTIHHYLPPYLLREKGRRLIVCTPNSTRFVYEHLD